MKILLVYPPTCTPTMPPYSLAYLKNFLKNNLDAEIICLDLNAKFHMLRFPSYYEDRKKITSPEDYAQLLTSFDKASRAVYAENNKKIIQGIPAEKSEELLGYILEKKPDLVALSFVYNSQCFYGMVLLQELRKRNISCVIGGPAVNGRVKYLAPRLQNEIEMLQYCRAKGCTATYEGEHYRTKTIPDFSDFPQEDYLSKERILPLKTSTTCFYKQCTFCTHFAHLPYLEYEKENIRESILKNNAQYIYFIDDMIAKDRLLELASMLKPMKVKWWCQLRPTKDLLGSLGKLAESGLRSVSWGVESGNQRILDLMKKGTKKEDVERVLQESHEAGIKNMLYIMFGFPTETREEFLETIEFLKQNKEHIDIISTSIFGLQKGAKAYNAPEEFGILTIQEKKRTVLDPSISYTVQSGLHNEEARILQKKHQKSIEKLDKLPRVLNYFKEQTLIFE